MFSTLAFCKTVESLHLHVSQGHYLLLVGEKTVFSLETLPSNISCCGAIFPRIIFETRSFDEGIVVARLEETTSWSILEAMCDTNGIAIKEESRAVLALIDGLSYDIECFLETIFDVLPEKTNIVGAGAGKLTLVQEPVIFDTHRFYENAALLFQSPHPMSLGVKHGWEAIVSPLMATKTNAHCLEKINFQDAFEVYKNAVEADSSKRFNTMNFFDIAKAYPFGIVRYNKDFIVRDPIFTDGKSITLVGSIDANSVIALLRGDKNKLIDAAKEATRIASKTACKEARSCFVVDCISRFLFLEDTFCEELEAIASCKHPSLPLWGVLSLGEIANANDEGIEFYNKTCVVCTI